MATASVSEARIPCAKKTREEKLRPMLRGGETWDSLLRNMAEQYDPEEGHR